MDRVDVVIVGGGASGALLAAQLLRQGFAGDAVIVQDTERTGLGIAYATPWGCHLLNVPARNMSALPDAPDDFVRYLATFADGGAAPDTFAPRRVYGEYLEHVLGREIAASPTGRLARTRDRVVDVAPQDDGLLVVAASGRRWLARAVVLATGFHAARRWALPGACANPWAPGALEALPLDRPLLALGAGLTLVDVALALDERGFRSRLTAISRRGLLPGVHARPLLPPVDWADGDDAARDAGELTRRVRRHVTAVEAAGGDWRQAIDGLRPHTQRLWGALPMSERARFLRHARPWWDTARHRMAPAVGERLRALVAAGRLEFRRGRLVDVLPVEGGVRATIAHGATVLTAGRFGAVIDCTGPQEDYRRVADPLVAALAERGLALPHRLGIGWPTAPDGALLDAAGRPSPGLFTLGPPRRGDLWESTAIPEIRGQARDLAQRLRALVG